MVLEENKSGKTESDLNFPVAVVWQGLASSFKTDMDILGRGWICIIWWRRLRYKFTTKSLSCFGPFNAIGYFFVLGHIAYFLSIRSLKYKIGSERIMYLLLSYNYRIIAYQIVL